MRKRMMKLLLGVTACLALMGLGMGVVHAGMMVTNSASLRFTDHRSYNYQTITDTAQIVVYTPPAITIQKDVKNVRTGETSPDVVVAYMYDTIEFTLTFRNSGDTDAVAVLMYDSIPMRTTYVFGSATDTNNLDPVNPPDTITFQHAEGGPFNTDDSDTVTAIRWYWNKLDGTYGNNTAVTKFRVRVNR